MAKKKQKSKSVKKAKAQPSLDDAAARILRAIKRIPRGKVSTYGDIADVAGMPRRARLVGTVLKRTPATAPVPWYRVINAGGKISFPVGSTAHARQRSKLEAEGVVFLGETINLKRYGWPARDKVLDELLWKPG